MTVPQEVKLARHAGDLDDDGHDIYAVGTDDQTAAEVPFTPAAGIAATDVQAAIVEDAGDLAAHLADTTDAHDASAISIVDVGTYFTGTDVEAALQELGAGAGSAITVQDEGTPLTTAATTFNFVGSGVTATGAGATKTITIPGGSGTLPWFNVKDAAYGAVGNGSTDDTAAINLAIAALNSATRGVLYFPAGAYKVSSALTTITAAVLVRGDGSASMDYAEYVTTINFTSQTAVLFTVSGKYSRFENIGLQNTYAGTPSAGCAIFADSSYLEQKCDFEGLNVRGFYDNIYVKVGAQWSMHSCLLYGPVRYGLRISNTVNGDAGDWVVSDSWIYAGTYNATAAILMESSGGGKIANVKVNSGYPTTNQYTTGIDVNIASGVATLGLWVSNSSIENISGDAIRVVTTGTGIFSNIHVNGFQTAFTNNTGYAVKISAAANSGHSVAGSIDQINIDNGEFYTTGTARPAISLTNVDKINLGEFTIGGGFTSRYTATGCTNVRDASVVTLVGDVSGDSAATSVDKVKGVTITDAGTTGDVLTKTGALAATWSTPSATSTGSGVTDHFHIVDEQFSGDGSTTVFYLANTAVLDTVMAYISGTRTPVTLGGVLNDEITFGSAPASATLNVSVDYAAVSS